ncbi:MAG: hypothetical protein AB8H86_15800 [Polyangiales bacterium]
MPALRVGLAVLAFIVFIRWAGGQRATRISFGSIWFMLTRPAVLVLSTLGTLGMAAFLWFSMLENGRDPAAAPLFILGVSVMCGVGFAALVAGPVWMARKMRTPKPVLALGPDENVVEEWPMNHFLGLESRGGRGYLTESAIHFVPTRFVVQTEPWSLPLNAIVSATVEGGRLVVIRDDTEREHWLIAQNPKRIAKLLQGS